MIEKKLDSQEIQKSYFQLQEQLKFYQVNAYRAGEIGWFKCSFIAGNDDEIIQPALALLNLHDINFGLKIFRSKEDDNMFAILWNPILMQKFLNS